MISIAIDGPAGAGKSTMAKKTADELGYIYVDTGALYRAIGLAVREYSADISDRDELCALLGRIDISIVHLDGEQHIFLDGKDVSHKIRTEEISMMASRVSALPEVRSFLLELQRDFAKKYNVVMDGRDIGTVVLPTAEVKIFLTASPEVRASRRKLQLEEKDGVAADYDAILEDIIKRDYNDTHRDIAPLKPADDAVIIDTSDLTLSQAVEKLLEVIKEHIL